MIGGVLKRETRVKKPRVWERKIYAGSLLLIGEDGVLQMRRGAFVRKTDAEGAIVSDSRDESAGLYVNIGDKVVAAKDDAICVLAITRIEPGWAERLTVHLVTGVAENGLVFVLNAKGIA